MTSRPRVRWTKRLLPLAVPLLVLPLLGAPAQADPSDPADPPAATSPRENAEQALEVVEEIIEAAPQLIQGAADDSLLAEGKDLTLALRDLAVRVDDLPAGQRAAAKRLLARPDDSLAVCQDPQAGDLVCYGGLSKKVSCNSAVCVHWVTQGPSAIPTENDGAGGLYPGSRGGLPDYVEFTLSTMAFVAKRFVDAGYRPVLADGSAGGSSRPDIYLGQLGDVGAYGYCAPDDVSISEHVPSPAYCVLDNDYTEFGIAPRQALRATAAHEWFHAVQFAYDVNEDGWIMEATATWAEDELFDTVNDNWNYLPYGSLARPQQPLDVWNDLGQYGNWIFFRFLGERMSGTQAGMSTVVRDIWNRLPDEYSVEAMRNVLAARGSSVTAQFAWFNVWNRRPASYYDEGAAYPASPTRGTYTLSGQMPKKVIDVKINHLASSHYRYTRPATGGTTWRLQLKFNLSSKATGGTAIVSMKVKGHSPKVKIVALNADGDATYTYPFGPTVEWIDVTPINASTNYNGCDDPDRDYTSTCQGFPADDAARQVISGLAYSS